MSTDSWISMKWSSKVGLLWTEMDHGKKSQCMQASKTTTITYIDVERISVVSSASWTASSRPIYMFYSTNPSLINANNSRPSLIEVSLKYLVLWSLFGMMDIIIVTDIVLLNRVGYQGAHLIFTNKVKKFVLLYCPFRSYTTRCIFYFRDWLFTLSLVNNTHRYG